MKNKYYDSIDNCPFLIFLKINEGKKDKTSLCFEGEATEEESEKAWDSLYSEYVNEFGVSPEYAHYLQQKALLCSYYDNYYNQNQTWYEPLIIEKEQSIRNLEAKIEGSSIDFNEMVGKLAKKMGFAINISKITIREFYSYVKS